ncbi:uncharacterized protein N7473_002359 [Penicillium subrubescens]|uniref:uncharacterized protein n=1 Tax=Penicillium subrubescens TaxID=1316194 RepID=UPI002545B326|nr:uncharacterized protein N7473_002359 [Penicillium subrubescens]KAJ5905443.1 hypothetical protein N7473_002359 [Penicillium subrubescens]
MTSAPLLMHPGPGYRLSDHQFDGGLARGCDDQCHTCCYVLGRYLFYHQRHPCRPLNLAMRLSPRFLSPSFNGL